MTNPTPLTQTLKTLREKGHPGLMTHLVLGYPGATGRGGFETRPYLETIAAMATAGADLIELQIPFSDPIADGPTMMRASQAALDAGMTVTKALKIVTGASQSVQIPLLIMTYYNIVFRYGLASFCAAAKDAGASGLLVPDMPPEEEGNEGFFSTCEKYGLANIGFVSPATPIERLSLLDQSARGFLYCFATYGITGARKELDPRLTAYLDQVRAHTTLPLAVGFGITTRAHIEAISPHADIAIVGSAMLDRLDTVPMGQRAAEAAKFVRELKGGS